MSTLTSPVGATVTPEQLAALANPRVPIFNPGDPENVTYFGRYKHAPANGVFYIEGLMQHPRGKDSAGKTTTFLDKYEPQPGGSAKECVDQILFRYADRGYVPLLGDGRDEERMEAARAVYIAWRLEYALAQESSWIAKVQAITSANPGTPPPKQTKVVRAQLAWLQQHRAGLVDRKEFICRLCSSEFDVLEGEASILEHATASHPGIDRKDVVFHRPDAIRQAVTPPPAPPGEVGVPGSETDPGDNQGEVGAAILKQAKALGVNLTRAELMGLIEDNEKVVDEVVEKLAAAKAKKAS